LSLPEEIARRQDRLEQLRAASEVIKARAKERYQQELSQFQAKEQERVERAKKTGKSLEDALRNRLGKALGTRINSTSPTRRVGS
jgi:F0F1-type ATP synthase membrane subunit b/b'